MAFGDIFTLTRLVQDILWLRRTFTGNMLQCIFETFPSCLFIQRLSVRAQEVPKSFSNLVPECLSSSFYRKQTSTIFHSLSYHCFIIRPENLSIRKGGYIFKVTINHMFPINDCGNSIGNFHLRSKRSNQHSMQLSSRAWDSARRKEKKKYFADTAALLFLNVHIILPKYNCHFHLTISSCVSVRMSRY